MVMLIFCAGSKLTRAVKFGLSWVILAKLAVIVLISDLFWFVCTEKSLFSGFLGKILDSSGVFLVRFMA